LVATPEASLFVSRVMLVPEENLGVVILTNAEEGARFDSILSICWIPTLVFRHGLDCGLSRAAKDEREKAATQVMIDRSNADPRLLNHPCP